MGFLPQFGLVWLGGWLPLALLALTDAVLFLAFRRDVVTRLFDRSGWSRKQKVFTVIGKLMALVTVLMIIFTPLKIGSWSFVIGAGLAGLGLIGLLRALFDFRNTPPDQPVVRGIYGVTRHPQNMASSLVILGCTIAIGSWLALILFAVARIFLHQNLVAEEEVCLQAYGQAYRSYMERVPRYLLFF
jgi:protein-S-isoprenylcysteine O-methyltransferase Ste14